MHLFDVEGSTASIRSHVHIERWKTEDSQSTTRLSKHNKTRHHTVNLAAKTWQDREKSSPPASSPARAGRTPHLESAHQADQV